MQSLPATHPPPILVGVGGAQHMVLNEEQIAFSDWINTNLSGAAEVGHLLPLKVRQESLAERRWVFNDYFRRHSDLRRRENGLKSA